MENYEIEDVQTIHILAIISLFLMCIIGPFTIVVAIIALIMAQNRINAVRSSEKSFSNIHQLYNSKIIAIVSIIINSIIFIVALIFYAIMFLSYNIFEKFLNNFP